MKILQFDINDLIKEMVNGVSGQDHPRRKDEAKLNSPVDKTNTHHKVSFNRDDSIKSNKKMENKNTQQKYNLPSEVTFCVKCTKQGKHSITLFMQIDLIIDVK